MTLEQIKSLRAKQGFEFRDQSKNGQYQVQTSPGRWDHEALRHLRVCAWTTAAAALIKCSSTWPLCFCCMAQVPTFEEYVKVATDPKNERTVCIIPEASSCP